MICFNRAAVWVGGNTSEMGTEPDDVVVPLTEEGLREAAGEVSACVISRGHFFIIGANNASLFPVVKRSSALMLCPPLSSHAP